MKKATAKKAALKKAPAKKAPAKKARSAEELRAARLEASRISAVARAIRREEAEAQEPEADPCGELVMPYWPDEIRGVSNALLRSSLFTAGQPSARGAPEVYVKRDLHVVGPFTIKYAGPVLTQSDADGWMGFVHLLRRHPLGKPLRFTKAEFLRAAGRDESTESYEWLAALIVRLCGAVINIWHGDELIYSGALLQEMMRDADGMMVVQVNPRLHRLYGRSEWTGVNWEERRALGKAKAWLAMKMHLLISSHAKFRPTKVATLRELAGTPMETAQFRRRLKSAMLKLEGLGWTWRIDEHDMLHVHRPPSKAQARHLDRKRLE